MLEAGSVSALKIDATSDMVLLLFASSEDTDLIIDFSSFDDQVFVPFVISILSIPFESQILPSSLNAAFVVNATVPISVSFNPGFALSK